MSANGARLPVGGCIDRKIPLRFSFDGQRFIGYQGDTLASALLANGVSVVARSFRYHRPRGIMTAGPEEPSALVTVGAGAEREPNVRATTQLLFDGLIAATQNCWPSSQLDLGTVPGWLSRFLPVGFYYKTFLWPRWHWYEGMIRRMAGLGTAPDLPDPDRYEKHFAHCDVLVVGGGPSGIAAALTAAQSGTQVILCDDQVECGGSLLWERRTGAGKPGMARIADSLKILAAMDNVRILLRTTVVAAYDHNFFTAIEILDGRIRQRLWRIRTRRTVLATGAIERPLTFPDNDRPGIMLAGAVRHYVNRYAVRPGGIAVLFTNNDDAYRTALDLRDTGVKVAAVIDVRRTLTGDLPQAAENLGIRILTGHAVCGTRGKKKLRSIEFAALNTDGTISANRSQIDCDLLCVSGGWSPTVHLLSQAGGKLEYDADRLCFVPARLPEGMEVTGAANGQFDVGENIVHAPPQAFWQTRGAGRAFARKRQWVDILHDVTVGDIKQAAREGFTSVEHMKRYTTAGMAADQGKTSNVNALAVLAEHTHRDISRVGTTTFRPPYQPVSLGALAGRDIGPLACPQRHLPLHDWHITAGGVMEDHGGWQRAACYLQPGETEARAIHREVLAVRRDVGLLDSSSLGKIEVSGPDAASFLNRIYINNVATLKTGRIRYGMMLNENGTIKDDGVFARLSESEFLVSTSSAGFAAVSLVLEEWLQCEWPNTEIVINPVTTQWATLAITGPKSRQLLSTIVIDTDLSAAAFPHMSIRVGNIDGFAYRLMRVSFTGEISFELSIPAAFAWSVWQRLLDAGKQWNATPVGMEALDILRVEKGYLEVGAETDAATTPLDVGWGAPIAKKQADFIGKRSLARAADQDANRLQLVGLISGDHARAIPIGSHILNDETQRSDGHITSSCLSPTLGHAIALAMLRSGQHRIGETVHVDIDGRIQPVSVVAPAFYDPEGERLRG